MIKKFDTNFGSTPSSSGSSKNIITLLVVVGLGFLAYQYVVKPMMNNSDKENK